MSVATKQKHLFFAAAMSTFPVELPRHRGHRGGSEGCGKRKSPAAIPGGSFKAGADVN